MKRVGIVLASMLVLLTLLIPATSLAAQSTLKAKATQVATSTGLLIVYPEAKPDISAEAAYASTPWTKGGDGLNVIIALLSVGAVVGIVVWGVIASRNAGKAAA